MKTLDMLRPYARQMIEDRRWLHEHPELSGQERQTLAYITKVLEGLGLVIHCVESGGVIGVLDGAGQGPCVLLRADCDALPIRETPDNLRGPRCCISQNDGVMHACGHDAHMAMLLGAARALAAHREEVPGRVLFVFEQGEEKGGKGFLKNLLPYIDAHFAVDACYATHVRWDIPAGRVSVSPGAVMTGAFGFDINIHGRGGHGSRPDLAESPIDCFSAIHQQLLALRLRTVEPDKVLTYSLGLVQAGEQGNVIPDTLRFAGTVRTFDTAGTGERFAAAMRQVIDHTCAAQGCTAEYTHFSNPQYEVYNDPTAADLAQRAIRKHLGEDALADCAAWMASESMNAYLKLWPGVLAFTGIRNEALGSGANHHPPQFDVDEAAMLPGAAAACAFALEVLAQKPDFGFVREIVSMEDLVSRSI